MTNGDKIRSMNNEELASFVRRCKCCAYSYPSGLCDNTKCREGTIEYLNQEVTE